MTAADPLREVRETIRGCVEPDPPLLRRFALAYLLTLAPLGAALTACFLVGGWAIFVLTAVIAGFTQNALGILMHEASHTFVHPNRRLNDVLADVFVCLPLFNTVQGYRLPHLAHHRHAGHEDDPHYGWYGRYASRGQFLRCLLGDLCGLTVVSHFLDRYCSPTMPVRQPSYALPAFALVQAGLFGLCWGATGWWWAYAGLWFAPLCTIPHAVNRIRTFVEHQPEQDGTPANRSTVPTWLEWLLIAPYGYSYHFEHHAQMNVPYFRLPAAHRALAERGYPFVGAELAAGGYGRTFARLWRQLGATPAAQSVSRAA